MRRRHFTTLAASTALMGLAGRARADAEPQTIEIGVVAAVTGSFASATRDTFDGFNAWLKGRGSPGHKINITTLDDETNPVNAATLFRRLAGDPKTSLIYIFTNSNSAIAIKSFASEYKVPIISGGGADVLGVPANPWLFKVAPANRDYMIAISEYMKKHGYTRLAHLYSNDTYGQYDNSNLKTLAPKYGYELVTSESFALDDTNFNAQLSRIRAAKPDLIYSSATGRAAILVFKQMKQLAIPAPVIVAGASISVAFFEGIGGADKADGLLTPIQLGSFGTKAGGSTALFYGELEKTLGHPPVFFNTFGFDVGLITEAALNNSDGSRQGIRDALEKLHDMPAINGLVSYSPEDHTGQDARSIAMGKMVNGVAVPVE